MPDQDHPDNPMDDELILYYYDELPAERRQQVRAQLLDPLLRARYDALCADLAKVEQRWEAQTRAAVPEDIGARAWQGLASQIGATSTASPSSRLDGSGSATTAPRQPLWMALAASVVLVVVATVSFQAGQRSPLPAAVVDGSATPAGGGGAPGAVDRSAQERVLLAQVQRHLGASERLLVDVSNGASLQATALGGSLGMTDEALEAERQWAKTLLTANRLYRFAAERAGQDRLSALLGDLEPILIDLANGRRSGSPQYADALRESIATRELLPRVRAEQSDGVPSRAPTTELLQEENS